MSPSPEEPSQTIQHPQWIRVLHRIEDSILVLCLGTMVVLPLVEAGFRVTPKTGIVASSAFVQNLTLFVGMFGGAIAAREKRLLSLASVALLLKGRLKAGAAFISGTVATTITGFLLLASYTLVSQERQGGGIIAYGIPIWVLQAVLPVGFALITLRLWWHSAHRWWGRFLSLGLITGIMWGLLYLGSDTSPIDPETLVWPLLITLLVTAFLGTPVFTVLGGVALILFWGQGARIGSIAVSHYSLVTNPSLPAIPLFTLAGYFLAEGGASKRLIDVFEALVGCVRGGPAVICVLVCAFFTSFTGASGVTILALGGLLFPILQASGYRERHSLGLLTSSGSLGLLFAPCLPLILYAIIAQNIISQTDFGFDVVVPEVTMQKMFLGGALPGLLLVLITSIWGIWIAGKRQKARETQTNHPSVVKALWVAKWELALPLVALGSLFSGKATVVESAALTAAYAFFTQVIIHRDLKIRELIKVMTQCGLLVGGVLLILGVAMGLTKFLIFEDIPILALEWIKAHIENKFVFLFCLNIFLLLVGCLMDIFSALVVVVPLIIPVGISFGIHPVHLGIIFLANLELGYMTPPVGLNLFLASYRFDKTLPIIYRSVLPILGLQLMGVLLITYLPWISTFLPGLFQ